MENEMIYSGTEHMDIKSGGREMATVVYSNEEEGMCSFAIDGEGLYPASRATRFTGGGDSSFLPAESFPM